MKMMKIAITAIGKHLLIGVERMDYQSKIILKAKMK